MAERIVGVVAAREISLTRKGMNPHATRVVLKSYGSPRQTPNPPPENDEMDMNVLKSVLMFTDAEKAHFAGLKTDDAMKAFVALDSAGRAAEIAKAAPAVVVPATGESEAIKALTELVKSQAGQIQSLVDTVKARDTESEIEKAAASSDYEGYPGGVEAVKSLLKTTAGLTEDARKPILDTAKAHAALCRATAKTTGYGITETELERAAPATAQLDRLAEKVASEKGIIKSVAMGQILADPANKALADKAYTEQGLA